MLTSIVVLTWNNLPLTQACIASVRRCTDVPYELIVVDNGSADGTLDWLLAQPDVLVLPNPDNRGFAAGCNQGLAFARGELLLLLNNDAVVTPGWLPRLQAALLASPNIGAVGPVSDFVLPMQRVTAEEGERIGGPSDPGKWRELTALSGFCLLLRRRDWKRVGPLDERYGAGGFEDIDYGYRLLRAGLGLRLAGDVFVRHAGNRSFERNGLDMYAIGRENRRLFIRQWGFDPDRLILRVEPAFRPGAAATAHPHHPPAPTLPSGWYGADGSGRVYRIERGAKRPIHRQETFERLRLAWDQVVQAPALLGLMPDGEPIDLDGPLATGGPDVFLARDPGGSIHLVAYGIRHPFPDQNTFLAYGYGFEEAVPVSYERLLELPIGWPMGADPWADAELIDGRLYAAPDGGLYYGEGQRLRAIPSPELLARYGWQSKRPVSIPAAAMGQLRFGCAVG